MRIYKYPLEITDEQCLWIPMRSKMISAQMQNGKLCLWAIVNPDAPPMCGHIIRIFGTGHEIVPDGEREMEFIDTVQDGELVWHVFHEHS